MLNRFVFIFFICVISIFTDNGSLHAGCRHSGTHTLITPVSGFASYPKQIAEVVKHLDRMPEVRQLIKEASKDGAIRLITDSSTDFPAYWDSRTRTIGLNPHQNRSKGSYLSSIIFELHNAKSDKTLTHLTNLAYRGQISKERYVEEVERMEYENAVSASSILNEGISRKIFPREARWSVFHKFEDHYLLQKLTGHSDFIAANYDHMNQGRSRNANSGNTWRGLNDLSDSERNDYIKYLSIKNDLESDDRDDIARGTKYLRREYDKLEKCYLGKSKSGCELWEKQLQLMENVFHGNPVYETMTKQSPMITRKGNMEKKPHFAA